MGIFSWFGVNITDKITGPQCSKTKAVSTLSNIGELDLVWVSTEIKAAAESKHVEW